MSGWGSKISSLFRGEFDARSSETTLKKPAKWLVEALDAAPVSAGVSVNEKSAMGITAVFACVRVRAESISSIPLKLYRRTDKGRDLATNHPLYRVIHIRPNPLISSVRFREMMSMHIDLWGNFFAEIQRDNAGRIVALWPISPDKVQVRVHTDGPEPKLTYQIAGLDRPLGRDRILHIAGLGFDGFVGKSVIRLHREGLGIAVAAERYGAKFFANDARPSIVMIHPGVMGEVGQANFKKSWNQELKGVDNAWRIKVLEEGMKIEQIGLPPGDAQFIETRKYQLNETAAIYRVPPHKIGNLDRATFSNIEHQQLEFVDALRPLAVRIEQDIQLQLIEEKEQVEYYAEHVFDGLLRGDTKSRFDAYAVARQWGWLSVNDIRGKENLNPVKGGDVYLQPLNMVPAGTNLMGDRSARIEAPNSRSIERRALPERYGMAKALEKVYRDTFSRVFKREAVEIRKAVKRFMKDPDTIDQAGFEDWVVSFADEHAEWMTPRVMPVYDAMAEAMIQAIRNEMGSEISMDDLSDFIRRYVDRFALRHTGSTRGQMLALSRSSESEPAALIEERLDEWEEKRASKEALDERVRSSNAVTRVAFALVGVLTLTWRTVGESCPICDEMDGRSVSINDRFLSTGDTVAGLTSSTNISGPPVHQGCDCILMPGTGSRSHPAVGHRISDVQIRALFEQIIDDYDSMSSEELYG